MLAAAAGSSIAARQQMIASEPGAARRRRAGASSKGHKAPQSTQQSTSRTHAGGTDTPSGTFRELVASRTPRSLRAVVGRKNPRPRLYLRRRRLAGKKERPRMITKAGVSSRRRDAQRKVPHRYTRSAPPLTLRRPAASALQSSDRKLPPPSCDGFPRRRPKRLDPWDPCEPPARKPGRGAAAAGALPVRGAGAWRLGAPACAGNPALDSGTPARDCWGRKRTAGCNAAREQAAGAVGSWPSGRDRCLFSWENGQVNVCGSLTAVLDSPLRGPPAGKRCCSRRGRRRTTCGTGGRSA